MRSQQRPQRDPLIKQMAHGSNYTEFRASPTPRAGLPQPLLALGMRQQVRAPLGEDQQGRRYQRKHAGPCLNLRNAGGGKTQGAFGIAKTFLTAEAARAWPKIAKSIKADRERLLTKCQYSQRPFLLRARAWVTQQRWGLLRRHHSRPRARRRVVWYICRLPNFCHRWSRQTVILADKRSTKGTCSRANSVSKVPSPKPRSLTQKGHL